mgnify:CR=1 FL=1
MDLHLPKDSSNPPLLIYIHGGYWRAIDKNDHSFIALPFIKNGIAVANVNYDLCPSVTLTEIVDEIIEAFHFVRNQVEEWKTNGVYLIGHSAGAHLAGEIIGRKFFGREKDQSRLKGSILLSGIYEPEVVLHLDVNEDIKLDREMAFKCNLINNPPLCESPIFDCVVGIKFQFFNFILFLTFFHNILNRQKELRVGYINMEYILSNIEDFEVANKEFEYKIDQWKKEISNKENEIKVKREELEFEKDLIPNQIYLKRNKELDYDIEELESYRNKRFGPEGDWLVQEKILIQPIQDEVLAIVQQIAEKNKFDFIFDKSSAVIMLYSEKKYDISELVLRSILRQEKNENLEIGDATTRPQ